MCGLVPAETDALTTTYAGEAITSLLPSVDQNPLLCDAKFEKRTQLDLSVATTVALTKAVKVAVTQSGMKANEPCTETIPASTTPVTLAQTVELACPGKSLGPGMLTSLSTDADLTKHLVQFASTASGGGSSITSRKIIEVVSTQDDAAASDYTSCTLTISALPPLLNTRLVAGGTGLTTTPVRALASQDQLSACSVMLDDVSSPGTRSPADCRLGQGILTGREATLWADSTLDDWAYMIGWNCINMPLISFSPSVAGKLNWAKVMLNANPNDGGVTVNCTGTVYAPPIKVRAATSVPELQSNQFEQGVRQSHQSAAWTAYGTAAAVARAPICDKDGLKSNARTNLPWATSTRRCTRRRGRVLQGPR